MFNLLKNRLAGLYRFLYPGYELTITATDLDEVAFNRVGEIIKDSGFIFVTDRDSVIPGAVISEYTRKKKYLISIILIHTKLMYPERRLNLSIKIANEYSKPASKKDIDDLGAILYKELSQFAGNDKLTMNCHRTSIPIG